MPLPRFRLRTLMIAVALVAGWFAYPVPIFALLLTVLLTVFLLVLTVLVLVGAFFLPSAMAVAAALLLRPVRAPSIVACTIRTPGAGDSRPEPETGTPEGESPEPAGLSGSGSSGRAASGRRRPGSTPCSRPGH